MQDFWITLKAGFHGADGVRKTICLFPLSDTGAGNSVLYVLMKIFSMSIYRM